MKAILFSAGLGSRLRPYTDNIPKALVSVNGKSLLERNVLYLQKYGITDLLVNVHHFSSKIIEAIQNFGSWGSKITISDESDFLLETGGGLKKAAWFFKGGDYFLAMNVDVLTTLDLGLFDDSWHQKKSDVLLAVSERKSDRKLVFDGSEKLVGWTNTKSNEWRGMIADNFADGLPKDFIYKSFSGIQLISVNFLDSIRLNGKFSLIDVYLDRCNDYIINFYDHSNDLFIDVGKPESLQIANEKFKEDQQPMI